MTDDPYDFFDSVLALREEWERVAEQYASHSSDLFRSGVAGGRLSAGSYRELLSALMLHVTAEEQIRKCIEQLDELLMECEDRRQEAR